MLWDYNHVIDLKLGDASAPIKVIPSTLHEDLVLMNKNCKGCWSMPGSKWNPDVKSPLNEVNISHKLDFVYMMHLYEATLEGKYWMLNVCLDSDQPVCSTDFIVFAIEKATPWFNVLGDGYIGLAPSNGNKSLDAVHNNILDQMHFKKMINTKVFGVHTHMYNSTEDPSQIRFGGYNEDLLREDHEVVWFKTASSKSWGFEIISGGLHENLFNTAATNIKHAIIEPGYPYIAMPKLAFVDFVNSMQSAYPEEPMTCSQNDWCFFYNPCEDVKKHIPDLVFEILDSNGEQRELRVPPSSFLFSDTDYKTKLEVCHVGIIGMKFNDMQMWVFGQAFMENFYTIFDGSDSNNLKIGLNVRIVSGSETNFTEILALSICAVLGIVVFCLFVVLCCRHRQEARLEHAKT